MLLDSPPLNLRYISDKFILYCPLKNNIVLWNLLVGKIQSILRNQTPAEISGFDIIEELNFSVVGDQDGTVMIRKLENGISVKKLHKHKSAVVMVLANETTSGDGQKYIFSASYDGEIAIFNRDAVGDFMFLRAFNLRKANPHAVVSSLDYHSPRNILIIGTNVGDTLFLDIDKNKIISFC